MDKSSTATPQPKAVHDLDHRLLGREMLRDARRNPLAAYRSFTVGESSGWSALLRYELRISLLGGMPGGLGFLLRKRFYPALFSRVGHGLFVGRHVGLRHPHRMVLGDAVTIDDFTLVDARGAGDSGVELGAGVVVNRNCLIQAKTGPIRIGSRSTIGSNSVLVSISGIEIGDSVMIAGGVYISAGAYHIGDTRTPVMEQGAYSKGPIRIDDNAWIGTGVVILDGVHIGRNAVIGAGAVVTKDIPAETIAAGVPARVLRRIN